MLGDRIGVMRDGKLLQLGAADAIYNRPADLFVAHFTGASNLLAGRVLARHGDFGTIDGLGRGRLGPSPHRLAAAKHRRPATPVNIAVRPENVRLGANGAAIGEPTASRARVLRSATRACRRSMSSRARRTASPRSSSAPLRAIRSAATST